MIRLLCQTILLLIWMTGSAPASPLGSLLALPRANLPLRETAGTLHLFPLTAEWLVVAGHYDDFFNQEIKRYFSTRLTLADSLAATGLLPHWSYRFIYNFATIECMSLYLPQIKANFHSPAYFRLAVNGAPVQPVQNGYWINAVGSKRTPYCNRPGVSMTNSADLVFFAYLKLPAPLKEGDALAVTTDNGESARLDYHSRQTISRAIKINQVGYAPEAGEKYAYLGFWLGDLGAMPCAEHNGKPFHLRRIDDDSIAFSGQITPRSNRQSIRRDERTLELDGEEVMQMDFSAFAEPGHYYLHVPGVGRSWNFRVGPDAIGRAFYVQMRGLFHQRSGIAKTSAHTQWTMGAGHTVSYRGGFFPNARHYQGEGSLCTDAQENRIDVRHFDLVRATATEEPLPNVYGGWWDAGDFDRRPYHFEAVDALLSVFLLFPSNFSDNQLDLPESGNGIPDIVDEAAWGVDLWRRAQNADGGVGCWLEATSHPENPDPVLDTQRYYLALPSRESTLQFCAYAAKLARAYRRSGAIPQAELFFASAEKAWTFAANPANRLELRATLPKQGPMLYREPEELLDEDRFKALINLYLYRRDEKYASLLDQIPFQTVLNRARELKNAYFLSELAEETIPYEPLAMLYRQMIRNRAKTLLKTQQELAYRNLNWPLDSPYFQFLGWGAGLPFNKGSYLIMAWQIDGDQRYRDAALLCFDWMCGANPMGRSLTTGLGTVYPVRLLSLPMWAWQDRLADPIPGLTPYTFSGTSHYSAASMIFACIFKPRPDHRFAGCNINLLPVSLRPEKEISQAECFQTLQHTLPLWRRFACLEGYAVNQNEFSVWETIAPAAAAYAALLTPGWTPPAEWKKLAPQPDLKQIPGFIFLP